MSNVIEINGVEQWASEVIDSKGVVLVEFGAPWCGPCKAMAPILESVAGDYIGRAKIVSVDIDANQSIASSLGLRAVPTIMVWNKGEKTSERVIGAINKEKVKNILEKYIEKENPEKKE